MSRARLTHLAGPVLHARAEGAFCLRESVRVGPQALLGEVVRLDGADIVVQVYEDTTGLRPGEELHGDGAPLSIRLGPALLGGIFDGLLRPLAGAPARIAPGMRAASPRPFVFAPAVAAGERVGPGASLGTIEVPGTRRLAVLVPPRTGGVVRRVLPAGEYADDAPLAWLEGAAGNELAVAMSHAWPVREPRPVSRRLPAGMPLVTGQRVLDSLFPVALGGKAAIPGGFGTGKTVLLETLAKGCAADVIVYLGCGERGN
jgi:V/A-type H+-transporting ATPase subunit A